MPHRIIIKCPTCADLKGNSIEMTEVTFWIDEDKKLYFIANCNICEQSRTIQTSVEEIHQQTFRKPEALAPTPLYLM